MYLNYIFFSEDCIFPKESIQRKLGLDIDLLRNIKPTEKGLKVFKKVAARFVSSFSIAQKSCKTYEAGFKEASSRLVNVSELMELAIQERVALGKTIDPLFIFDKLGPGKTGPEIAILLRKEQSKFYHSEHVSSFIHGGFG